MNTLGRLARTALPVLLVVWLQISATLVAS